MRNKPGNQMDTVQPILLGTKKFKKLLWNTYFGISERHEKARSWVIFKNLEKLLTEHKK